MKIGQADVSSDRKVIGVAEFPVFDSIEEAINHPERGLGEEKVLDLLNAQIKTNEMNTIRTAATKGPTKSALRSQATNEILTEIAAAPQDYQNIIGNEAALNNLIAKRMTELEARAKETAASMAPAGVGDEEE
jgi:hypothetical protein